MNRQCYFSLFISLTAFNSQTRGKIICNQCPAPKEDSYVFQYCRQENVTGSLQQNASCCFNTTAPSQDSQIIGVDMSECGLNNLTELFVGLENLIVLMLQNNSDLQIKEADFQGLSKLIYLSLPSDLQCPGGNKSWDSIEKQNSSTICRDEINLCVQNNGKTKFYDVSRDMQSMLMKIEKWFDGNNENKSVSFCKEEAMKMMEEPYYSVTCQNNNSQCVLTGPGQMECLCLPGYYGYKCLRQGTFPSVNYTIILCACTLGISGFLWCTQRRKVGKKEHTH